MIRLFPAKWSAFAPVLALAVWSALPAAAQTTDPPPPQVCDVTALSGKYLVKVTGSYYDRNYNVYLLAIAGFYTMDGNGAFSGNDTINNDGVSTRRTVSGTYTINADCTGTIIITGSDKVVINADIVVDKSNNASLVGTDSYAVFTGTATKQ